MLAYICWPKCCRYGLKNNAEVKELSRYVQPTRVLTPHERIMFKLLKETIPSNYSILCQVSFNAFIKCDDIGQRNRFNRKMLDFLIIDQNFIPVVCIELDDYTHKIKHVQEKDEYRDNLLSAALIPTERFNGIPKDKAEISHRINRYIKNHKNTPIYSKLINTK